MFTQWRHKKQEPLKPKNGPIVVGGAVARPTASSEPDMKPFDCAQGMLSLHPALQITGSCHERLSDGLHRDSDRAEAPD